MLNMDSNKGTIYIFLHVCHLNILLLLCHLLGCFLTVMRNTAEPPPPVTFSPSLSQFPSFSVSSSFPPSRFSIKLERCFIISLDPPSTALLSLPFQTIFSFYFSNFFTFFTLMVYPLFSSCIAVSPSTPTGHRPSTALYLQQSRH